MVIDAVITSPHYPIACGSTKWSHELARRLQVPCLSLSDHWPQHALVSVRLSECGGLWPGSGIRCGLSYDLLVHDLNASPESVAAWARGARRVYAASPQLADGLRQYRDDVLTLWGPACVDGSGTRGELEILTFGFAHKFQGAYFQRLKALLDRTPASSYTVVLSSGIHEGRSWGEDLTQSMSLMRGIFGDRLRCFGFVADDGLTRILRQVNAVALFFDPGVRANNTSFWAAMESNVPVITNLDAGSPPELQHEVNVFDIHQLKDWPDAADMRAFRAGAAKVCQQYSWDRLVSVLKAPVHA